MRIERGRKKKLIVAFHFLMGGQAGWKCDVCRRQGLEAARRCGWAAESQREPRRVVWARGGVSTEECPTSFVTPQSVAWVESFSAWRRGTNVDISTREAREADAFLLLEAELKEWREDLERSN